MLKRKKTLSWSKFTFKSSIKLQLLPTFSFPFFLLKVFPPGSGSAYYVNTDPDHGRENECVSNIHADPDPQPWIPFSTPTVVCLNFPDPVMRKDDRVILTNLLIQLTVKASIITGDHFLPVDTHSSIFFQKRTQF